jgi:hypothetical protein
VDGLSLSSQSPASVHKATSDRPDQQRRQRFQRIPPARAAAVIDTLVENCKRHGLDPCACLKDVLTRLPQGELTAEEVAHLTPARTAGVKLLDLPNNAAMGQKTPHPFPAQSNDWLFA